MFRSYLTRTSVVTLIVLLSGASPVNAQMAVLRFNIEEMTATADRIFLGRCVAVEETEEMIAQGLLPVTRYTFQVERAIKGRLSGRITFRQLGHPAGFARKGGVAVHGRAASPKTFFAGMPTYRAGDRVLLFLIPNYLGGKVTYPVGAWQGAFFIVEKPGQTLARNGVDNLGLFTAPYNGTKMKAADAKVVLPQRGEPRPAVRSLMRWRGAVPVDELLALVEQIVAAHRD